MGLLILVLYSQRRHHMTHFRTSPALQGTMTYHIGPSGFTVTGDKSNTTFTWDGTIDVVRSKDFVLLFISASGAYFFPKTLVNEPEIDQIRIWAKGSD